MAILFHHETKCKQLSINKLWQMAKTTLFKKAAIVAAPSWAFG
jgi:hypothetical protein